MVKSIRYKRVLESFSSASRHSVLAVTAGCVGRFPDWRQKMVQLVIMYLHVRKYSST